jgi:hypothetical protein
MEVHSSYKPYDNGGMPSDCEELDRWSDETCWGQVEFDGFYTLTDEDGTWDEYNIYHCQGHKGYSGIGYNKMPENQ